MIDNTFYSAELFKQFMQNGYGSNINKVVNDPPFIPNQNIAPFAPYMGYNRTEPNLTDYEKTQKWFNETFPNGVTNAGIDALKKFTGQNLVDKGPPGQGLEYGKPGFRGSKAHQLAELAAEKTAQALVGILNLGTEQSVFYKPKDKNGSGKEISARNKEDAATSISSAPKKEDERFGEKLARLAGVDYKLAAKKWKDKGGFEGLMANPGFTLGLALMQSSANGKTIDQGILDNFVSAGGISAEFADRIQARKDANMTTPIQATQADIDDVKRYLKILNVDDPNIWERIGGVLKGKKRQVSYDIAVETIANAIASKIAQAKGQGITIDFAFKKRIIDELIAQGNIKLNKNVILGLSSTLESGNSFELKAHGGPVEAGKPYIVGEKGPEIIIPTSDGNVLTNDDSQIYALLLRANPELQNVSKQRAEKIMKARFPEYFEG
jgi:hypothetical protein